MGKTFRESEYKFVSNPKYGNAMTSSTFTNFQFVAMKKKLFSHPNTEYFFLLEMRGTRDPLDPPPSPALLLSTIPRTEDPFSMNIAATDTYTAIFCPTSCNTKRRN